MPDITVGDPARVFDWIDDTTRRMGRAGLIRRIHPRPTGSSIVNLSSNDYVSLARDSRVIRAAAEAAKNWGAGATAARLVSGTTPLHLQLEEELAEFCGMEAAVVFSSGYMANLGTLTALCRPRSLLVADAFVHASLVDGCRLSGADMVTAAHSDPEVVSALLAERSRGRALVVTESVFSVDGDLAPMTEFLAVCRSRGASLVVDDAHGLGVIGAGG
ncbi:MAG: aminotransferase class I/II-fold pyridoxal phosphate-dependent enzyme, partial [Pseudonocardiaceae bacterium]